MRRREVIGLLGGAAAAALAMPLSAVAQSSRKTYRVAIFTTMPPDSDFTGLVPATPAYTAFIQGMSDLGYVVRQNLMLEHWPQQTGPGRYGEIGADLIRRRFDLIVTIDNEMVLELMRLKTEIPIVMASSSNPVQAGIVASLARPGGNITGFTSEVGPELEAKKLQLLKEAVHSATVVSYLGLKSDWESLDGESIRAAASRMGVTLVHAETSLSSFSSYFDALALIARERPHALFVARSPASYVNRKIIADFAAEHRLPAMYPYREFVEAGGLMSYGASLPDLFRRAAGHVDRIFKGAKPADLSVEQPTRFEMVLNMKTARALGLTITPQLLAQTDEMIE